MTWPGGRRAERTEAEAAAAVIADETRERARRTGEILRETRTERRISLADVEQDIRINRTYLEALENARFDLLPAPVYARGFMRSYARYLGLDPEEAVRAVPRDLPRPRDLDPMPGLRRAVPTTLPALPNISPRIAGAIGAVVLVIAAAVYTVPGLQLIGGGGGEATPTATATGATSASFDAPNLVGATREVATQTLERAGLTPLIFESQNTATAGSVFRQSPGAGQPVKRGDVITLFVSQGAGTPIPSGTATPTATPAQ
ncbi:MAG: helix-turn-helix domain-containing protein [Dehalococcoidia bacterium]